MVPAPTTAALNTNTLRNLRGSAAAETSVLPQAGLLLRLYLEPDEGPAERVPQRTADEDDVGDCAERAVLRKRVFEAQLDPRAALALRRAEGLHADEALLEHAAGEAVGRRWLDDLLGHPAPARRDRLPDQPRALGRPLRVAFDDAREPFH